MTELDEAVGVVPTDGRGSLPFALMHNEALVAVASWALGEAGVELLDFTAPWSEVVERGLPLAVHDPLCPGTPVDFLRAAVAEGYVRDDAKSATPIDLDKYRAAKAREGS